MLCMAGYTAAELLSPWPLKIIFDHLLLNKPLPPSLAVLGGLFQTGRTTAVLVISLAILVIAIFESLFAYLQQTLTTTIGYRLIYGLRCELFAHLQNLSLSFHNRARTGELMSRVTGETEALKDVFVESVLLSLSQLMTVLGMFIVMFLLNWRLSLVVLSTFPILFFTLAEIYRRIKTSTRRQRRREGRIAARLNEVLSSVRLIKAYGREQYEQERYEQESKRTLTEGLRTERMAAAAGQIVELIKAAGLCATVLYGAWLVIDGHMTPGAVLVFTAYLNDMYKPLRNLAKISTRFSRAVVSMQRIGEILDTEPEHWKEETAVVARRLRGEIVFENVSFDYGDGMEVLRDLSFTIAPGERVALIGPSGSGKSTIANLILRFYHATHGAVRLDGVDIESYRRDFLRDEIGVALQDTLLFGASIRENIAYGKPEATFREIETAASQASAEEFIRALPEGYETILGERGDTLSGGQRQRIALARAFIKNPSILILDEPTSSVDADSAALIHESIDRLRDRKTTLVIAHHFYSLERFDRILVLRRGRLLEQGPHAELLKRRGEYFRMLQAREMNG
ncbi:MAG: ABC transporter ATP-binding protein [Blastocatellia bacterium]